MCTFVHRKHFVFQSSKWSQRAALCVMGGVHTFGAVRLVPLFTTRSINVWSRIQSRTQTTTCTLSMSLSALQTFDLLEYVCRFLSVKQNTQMIQNTCIWNLNVCKKMWFLFAMLAAYLWGWQCWAVGRVITLIKPFKISTCNGLFIMLQTVCCTWSVKDELQWLCRSLSFSSSTTSRSTFAVKYLSIYGMDSTTFGAHIHGFHLHFRLKIPRIKHVIIL